MLIKTTDTIIAISTPLGKGAIGIIRLSGNDVYNVIKRITHKTQFIKKIYYTNFYNNDNIIIDKGLLIFFKKPKSFTGEDVAEFHLHCNEIILNNVINTALKLGVRLAEPGEFTFRAYINNKIDILQAESINTLINAKTSNYNKLILNTLDGNLSKELNYIKNDVILLISEVNATIDFPDDVNIINFYIKKKLNIIKKKLYNLINKTENDISTLKEIKIIILGDSNAGKSSLFNFLLKRNRSIISHILGTTRDFIEETLIINNQIFKIIDTAGFNQKSNCNIEKNGILKTFEQIKVADILILVKDITKNTIDNNEEIFQKIIKKFTNKKKILILNNKIDLIKNNNNIKFNNKFLYISLKKKIGLTNLKDKIFNLNDYNNNIEYIVNKRNYNLLIKLKKKIKILLKLIKKNIDSVIIADKLKEIGLILSEIVGENINTKIIKKIFSNFCIGK